MAKPVMRLTNSASALATGSPANCASRSMSTRLAPQDMTSNASPPAVRKTSEFAICATSQPRKSVACRAVRAPRVRASRRLIAGSLTSPNDSERGDRVRWPRRRRPRKPEVGLTLRWKIYGLVLAATVPLVALAVAFGGFLVQQKRETARQEATGRVLALITAVDTAVAASETALRTLAASSNLSRGDLKGFHEESRRFL